MYTISGIMLTYFAFHKNSSKKYNGERERFITMDLQKKKKKMEKRKIHLFWFNKKPGIRMICLELIRPKTVLKSANVPKGTYICRKEMKSYQY